MPSITLTDPVAGTTVASGLIATNNANLRNLLNAGLDYANLKGSPALGVNDVPVWNGTQFIKPSGTASSSTFLRGDGSWAAAVPASVNTASVCVSQNAAQSIPNNSTTAVTTFDIEIWKTDAGMHSTSVNPGRLICTVAGKYQVWAQGNFVNNASGTRNLYIRKNGATTLLSGGTVNGNAGDSTNQIVSGGVDLTVGDYIEVLAFQDSGGALNLAFTSAGLNFGMTKVDGAVVSYVGVPGSLVGQEIGVGSRTSTLSNTATTFAAGSDILASPINFTADGTTAYVVEIMAASMYANTTSSSAYLSLNLDGTDQGLLATSQMATGAISSPVSAKTRFVPAAGTHNLNGRLWGSGAGSFSLEGGAGGAGTRFPIYVRLTRAA